MAGKPWTILNYAFRPFFLLNGLFAVVAVLLWTLTLHGAGLSNRPIDWSYWHGHEMIVGFAVAAIAGFVLTAVATWTDRQPVQGPTLGWLVATWLTGRLAMALAGVLPAWSIAVLDLAFPVFLCALVSREVIKGGSARNYPIAVITGIIVLLDAVYHLGAAQILPGADRVALYLLIHLILLLITVIGGRIVPNFTTNWLRARGVNRLPQIHRPVEIAIIPITIAAGIAATFEPIAPVTGILALVAAVVHGLRLYSWRGLATVNEPLLFVLHIAYLWLPIGYLLMCLAAFKVFIPPTAALHALTMGGVGSMVLAMTTRVGLAHTGRALHAARLTVIAYVVLTIASMIRVVSPLVGDGYLALIDLSAAGWIVSFGIFSWVYWPVLTRPRADEKPERGPSNPTA